VLKEIHREMNIESVEKLLEETAEAREYQNVCMAALLLRAILMGRLSQEISEMLANNLSLDEEEAVQEELKQLQIAIVRFRIYVSNAQGIDPVQEEETREPITLPSVPQTKPETNVEEPEGNPSRHMMHSS